MRDVITGLTTRGRSFLAAGFAAAVCGLALGERGLLQIGVLLDRTAAAVRTRHQPHALPAHLRTAAEPRPGAGRPARRSSRSGWPT